MYGVFVSHDGGASGGALMYRTLAAANHKLCLLIRDI